MFDTLTGLLKHYSPSGDETAAVNWLAGRMRALQYQSVGVDGAGNAVGVRGEGTKTIVLLGHIDTVPGKIDVRLNDDRMFARGAVDAKGPLACFVDAAARVVPPPGWQIVVVGAVDEERNSLGARYIVDRYQPDYVIVGEPSGWQRVTLGYKGSVVTLLAVRQAMAHAAGAELSAPDKVLAAWEAVRTLAAKMNQGLDRVFDQVSPSVRSLESGDDGFEAWARITVGTRLPLSVSPEEWLSILKEVAGQHEVEVSPAGFPVPAFRAEKNTPLVRAFLRSIRAQGGKPGFVVKSGTADINIVGPAWKCPAAVYGPGDSTLDHSPEEHISLKEYTRAVDVLAGVLENVFSA